MKPIHQKPNTPRRRKRPGRKAGHEGSRRPPPEHIDEHKVHRAACCPHFQGPLKRCAKTRTRHTEDIPENIQPVVTEHTIHRDGCPHCKKSVEPRVPEALPGSQIGNRVAAPSAWLHYGLVQPWYRVQEILYPWKDKQAKRPLKRFRRHRQDLFPFLDAPAVPFANNAVTIPSRLSPSNSRRLGTAGKMGGA